MKSYKPTYNINYLKNVLFLLKYKTELFTKCNIKVINSLLNVRYLDIFKFVYLLH